MFYGINLVDRLSLILLGVLWTILVEIMIISKIKIHKKLNKIPKLDKNCINCENRYYSPRNRCFRCNLIDENVDVVHTCDAFKPSSAYLSSITSYNHKKKLNFRIIDREVEDGE